MNKDSTSQEIIARIRAIQGEHPLWENHNFGEQQPHRPAWGVVEETGEFFRALLKIEQNVRQNEDHAAKAKDSIGDILIFGVSLCNKSGIDIAHGMDDAGHQRWFTNDVNDLALFEDYDHLDILAGVLDALSGFVNAVSRYHATVRRAARANTTAVFPRNVLPINAGNFFARVCELSSFYCHESAWMILDEVWKDEVQKRDWRVNPENGTTDELPLNP